MCQAAVSNTVAQDEAKLAAVLKVLEAVYSAEGQSKMAGGAAVLSYNKEINITSSTSLEQVADIISANHLYMRLASTEIFRISEDVGHKMITGEYDAKAHTMRSMSSWSPPERIPKPRCCSPRIPHTPST